MAMTGPLPIRLAFAVAVVALSVICLGATPRAKRPISKTVWDLADPDPADTQRVAAAKWLRFPLLPDGRFPIGAWCAPPPSQNTDFRYAEYAQAGLNVTMGMLEDPFLPGPSLERLRVSERHGVYAFVRDHRVHPDEAFRSGWRADVDTVVATYRNEAALLGYFLADEPPVSLFPSLGALNRRFALRDRVHSGYVNLLSIPGKGSREGLPYTVYLRRFLDRVRPAFFSFDHYPLDLRSDSPYFIAGLDSVAYVSRESGVPFWAVLQLTAQATKRKPTTAEMAWQAHLAMAHGARGIVWFTYWTPKPTTPERYHDGPIAYTGRRTPSYGALSEVNRRLQPLGQELARFQSLGVRHVGPVPYGCRAFRPTTGLQIQSGTPLAVGFFQQPGSASYALLVNRDYKRYTTVRIIAPDTLLRWTKAVGLYRSVQATPNALGGVRNDIALAPGDAELVRLPRDFDYVATQ